MKGAVKARRVTAVAGRQGFEDDLRYTDLKSRVQQTMTDWQVVSAVKKIAKPKFITQGGTYEWFTIDATQGGQLLNFSGMAVNRFIVTLMAETVQRNWIIRTTNEAQDAMKSAWGVQARRVTAELKLTPKDKKVLNAFIDKQAASSKNLESDGTRLDGSWMGGRGIAQWEAGKIAFSDLGSRGAQTVQRALRKLAPANLIGASTKAGAERVTAAPAAASGVLQGLQSKKKK